MEDAEFKKYVDLIMSMSLDYILKGKLTRGTYIANLKTIIRIIEKRKTIMNGIKNCTVENRSGPDGNPAGGSVNGVGLTINWQNGPLGRDSDRIEPNGAFVETVISAVVARIEYYQASKFKCRENAIALTHLETALLWLNKRTADREDREVEGTHTV